MMVLLWKDLREVDDFLDCPEQSWVVNGYLIDACLQPVLSEHEIHKQVGLVFDGSSAHEQCQNF